MSATIFGIPFNHLKDPRITAEHRPLDDINTVDLLHAHADSYLTQPVADNTKVSAIVNDFLQVIGDNPALQATIPLFYELIYSFSQCESYFSALISKQLAPLSDIAIENQVMNLLSHISHLVAIMDDIGSRATAANVPSILTFPEINQCFKLLLHYKGVISDFSDSVNAANREALDELHVEIKKKESIYNARRKLFDELTIKIKESDSHDNVSSELLDKLISEIQESENHINVIRESLDELLRESKKIENTYNATKESFDELFKEFDEMEGIYRASEFIYLHHAIDILKKYEILPNAFQYIHKATLNQDDFFEISANTLPYFILDNFVSKVRADQVSDQDIFAMSHSLFQIKTLGTSDPEHSCQHYALLILIAQQTRHLQRTHETTDAGGAVPTCSSSTMAYAAPSVPATPTRMSIEYPQDLCIELITLWQSNKPDARLSELRILFANYQSQLALPSQHNATHLGQFYAMCFDYFLRTASKRLKLDPHTLPATQLQALMLIQTRERITARVGKSNTYQFVTHLNELCEESSTVAISAVDLTDDEKLVQCISTGAYQWEKSEFQFTFADYVEQVENIAVDFALYLILRDYLASKRRPEVELNIFNNNINALREKLETITKPDYQFTVNGQNINLDSTRSFIDDLLRTFITTTIRKKSTDLSIRLIGSLFHCMLIIHSIDTHCKVPPLEWAYTLLFLLKAMTKDTAEFYADEITSIMSDLLTALYDIPMIKSSVTSNILVNMLPIIYNGSQCSASEIHNRLTPIATISDFPEEVQTSLGLSVQVAINAILTPMITYTMEKLDSIPSDASIYRYHSVIFYTLLVALIKCRQAVNENQLFHIDTDLMDAPELLRTLHQQFQPSIDTSVSVDDMSATSDATSGSSSRSLSTSPTLSLSIVPMTEIAPDNATTDWFRAQLQLCSSYLEQYGEDMAARTRQASELRMQGVVRLTERHVLLLRKLRASRLSIQEVSQLETLRANYIAEQKAVQLRKSKIKDASEKEIEQVTQQDKETTIRLDEPKAIRLGELEDDIASISPLRYLHMFISPLIAMIHNDIFIDDKERSHASYKSLFASIKDIVCVLLEAAADNADIFDGNDHPLEYALLLLLLLKNIINEKNIAYTIIDENLAGLLTNAFENCSGTQITNNRRYTEIKLLFALHYVQLEFTLEQITGRTAGQHKLNQALHAVLKYATLRRVKIDGTHLRDRLKNHVDNLIYVDIRTYALMNEIITHLSIKDAKQFGSETPSLGNAFIHFPGSRDLDNLLYYKIQGDIAPIHGKITAAEIGANVDNHATFGQAWLDDWSVYILKTITRQSPLAIVISTQEFGTALTLKQGHLSTSIFTALMKLRTAPAGPHKTDIEPHIWSLLNQVIIHLNPIKPTDPVLPKPQSSPSSSRLSPAAAHSTPNVSRLFPSSSRGSLPTSASSSHIATSSAMWPHPAPLKSTFYIRIAKFLNANNNNLDTLLIKDEVTGRSLMDLVVREFCVDTLVLIVERCKEKNIDVATLLNTRDTDGNTVLHHAIRRVTHGKRVDIPFATQCDFVAFTIKLGANPNQPNKTGETPLEQVARINDNRRDSLLLIFGVTPASSAPSPSESKSEGSGCRIC